MGSRSRNKGRVNNLKVIAWNVSRLISPERAGLLLNAIVNANADIFLLSELHREELHGPLEIPGYQVFVRWSLSRSSRLVKGVRHSEAVDVAILVRDEFTVVRIPDYKHYLGIVSVKLLAENDL